MVKNQAVYLPCWVETLKTDEAAVIVAAGAAQRAADLIRGCLQGESEEGDTMSCTINFTDGERVEAKVYRHSNDHPDGEQGVLRDLEQFFAAVEEQAQNTGFTDPSCLAAKFVVWQAAKNAGTTAVETPSGVSWVSWLRPLDFTGVGILHEDRADIAYRYFVDCVGHMTYSAPSPYAGRRPSVHWEQAKDLVQRRQDPSGYGSGR